MPLVSTAPGKLVLLGEYAVLFGHPAAVMAVDRRACVELELSQGRRWTVVAPGYDERLTTFDLDEERGFHWSEPEDDAAARFALVEQVVGALVKTGRLDLRRVLPAAVTLDTSRFFHPTPGGMVKLGLGSSAALTVALAEGFRMWMPAGVRPEPLDLSGLLELHRIFQGGLGSGIDLAASHGGGVVEYRLHDGGRRPSAQPLVLPDDLHMVFVWTGRSASTSLLLARLDEELAGDKGVIAAVLGDLGQLSELGVGHLRRGDVPAFLRVVEEFGQAMARLGETAGIPVLSDEHVELGKLAKDLPVQYKPSGAGGGDLGIAFTDDPEAAAAFKARTGGEGFAILDLQVDVRGLETVSDFQDSRFIIHNPRPC